MSISIRDKSRLVDRPDDIDLAHALDGRFQGFGDFGHHLFGRSAGVLRQDDSGLDRESRIFKAP